MRNLVFGILVASTAILGFFAYQSSQKVVALEADLVAKAEAAASLEAEKAALSAEVVTLQSQMAEMVKAASDTAAAAAAVEATTTP